VIWYSILGVLPFTLLLAVREFVLDGEFLERGDWD